jgi:ATP-binding cassette, subfamily B, heavy metal transporter
MRHLANTTPTSEPVTGKPNPSAQHANTANAATSQAARSDWATLKTLIPYLTRYKWRVALALLCLIAAKVVNVLVPVSLKAIVDHLTGLPAASAGSSQTALAAALTVPFALIAGYGLLRMGNTLFTELREFVFAKVTQSAVREISLKVFSHLHALSLRFHLDRQTGGLTRDMERGSRGVSSLVSFALYSIFPTLIEIALVLGYLVWHYEVWFAVITVSALAIYIFWTISVTEWRTHFRKEMNELDSKANTKAIDSLLNYETVKYFGNEAFEAKRYDDSLQRWMRASIRSQSSLSLLNFGQSFIIATAVTLMVWRATVGVVEGRMTLGDLVLVNAFMIQLYIPLNFLGVLYREIKQSLTDMDKMFRLLDQNREVADLPNAQTLAIEPVAGARVTFKEVSFGYDAARPILDKVDFEIAPGTTTAVVGASGAGKSTLSRLLFRFYDVNSGAILINGLDIRQLTQDSLRRAIGIVPQDTVLFNDTIAYNIAYGKTGADATAIDAAAQAAQLDGLIKALPLGYDTIVGERGLKLSGGEKQRVAIARMILKDPPVVILDEATSALDTRNEGAIQEALNRLAQNRTVLVIAHRLSTIIDADQILVMDNGRVIELGTHSALLQMQGQYARMWDAQTKDEGASLNPQQPNSPTGSQE